MNAIFLDIWNKIDKTGFINKDRAFRLCDAYHDQMTIEPDLNDFDEDSIKLWCTENLTREQLKEMAGMGGDTVLDGQKREVVERLYDSLTIQQLEEIEQKYLSK